MNYRRLDQFVPHVHIAVPNNFSSDKTNDTNDDIF